MSHPRTATIMIELVVAVSLIALLATMGVGGIATILNQSAIDASTQRVVEASAMARQLACSPAIVNGLTGGTRDATKRYGIVLVDPGAGAKPWVAVTYGATASPTTVLMNLGVPVFRRELARSSGIFIGDTPTTLARMASSSSLGWCYQYDTGWLCQGSASTTRPAAVGITDAELTAAGVAPAAVDRGPAVVALGTGDGRRKVASFRCLLLGNFQVSPWVRP